MLTINAKVIAAAATCQAHNDVREYLCGIHFEPLKKGGVRAITTDGHRMLVITDKEAECDKPVTFKFDPGAITKMKNASAETVTIHKLDDDSLIAKLTGEKMSHVSAVEMIMGKFPNWKAVMPNKLADIPCPTAMINGLYLCGFGGVAKTLNIPAQAFSVVHGANDSDVVCIAFGQPRNANLSVRGLVMPMRETIHAWAS